MSSSIQQSGATSSINYGSLSTSQTQAYWEDGYLFPLRVLSSEDAAVYRNTLETMERSADQYELARPIKDYVRVHSECVMPFAAEMALNPTLLDMVASIIGPDIMIWGAEFFIKPAKSNQLISMHQDLTYWGFGETHNQVTAWLALSPSTEESGCMDLVKGSHKNEILPHKDTHHEDNMLSRGQEVEIDVREEDRTHVVLKPGEASLHHGLTIHGSHPNQSEDRRIGFAIRYISPGIKNSGTRREYAMQARGVDRSTAFIHHAPPKDLFSPQSLSFYEEVREEQAKTLATGMDSDQVLFKNG